MAGKTTTTRPSKRRIAEAQAELLRSVRVTDPMTHCWACNIDTDGRLERAHIVAARDGGSCDPHNFFLLCWFCHQEQPDGASVATQVFWLLNHESSVERVMRKARPFNDAVSSGYLTIEESVVLIRSGAHDG